jgi:hypothetical protein
MSKSNMHLFSISGTRVVISKLPLLSESPLYMIEPVNLWGILLLAMNFHRILALKLLYWLL